MTHLITVVALLAAPAAVPGQVDSICRAKCEILAVQGGSVKFIDQWLNRTVVLGRYAASAQNLVPRTEAPIREIKSARGWRIVASAYLDHDQDELHARLRLFGPDGKLKGTGDILSVVEEAKVAGLVGGNDEVFVVTSNEEHAYNAQTEIWLLPEHGDPKVLLQIQGDFGGFIGQNLTRGVAIARQTYDGIDAKTKGTVQELYVWNPETKSLVLEKR
jgi:hypothetical protein